MSEEFEPTTVYMDPGSPDPHPMKVKRKSSAFKHVEFRDWQISQDEDEEIQLMDEIAEDRNWILGSKVASNPEELVRATMQQGVALQSVKFKRPHFKCMIRVPAGTNERENVRVFVRYTRDGWKSADDSPARHCSDCISKMPGTELYKASVPLPHSMNDITEFALCLEDEEGEHWDNNWGQNHHVKPVSDVLTI